MIVDLIDYKFCTCNYNDDFFGDESYHCVMMTYSSCRGNWYAIVTALTLTFTNLV